MITANYFDGQDARRHPVELKPGAGALMVIGGAVAKEYAYRQVTLAEPFANAPAVLYFADGARCEVAGADAGQALADALSYRKSPVVRWQEHWYAALLALALLLASGLAMVTWGVPAAAEKIAATIPPALDQRLGRSALEALEVQLLEPSRLSEQRVAQVEQVLHAIAPADTPVPLRLLVRNSPRLGANALALPDGTIIITDAMVLHILARSDEFDEQQHARLAGILAHEIGHVARRHSVRVMARSSLTAAASATLFGDFSAVAASVPTLLMNMRYSRDMESEADGYAIALLRQKGISPAPLADLLESLEAVHQADPSRRLPRWMAASLAYVASHPAGTERSERLRHAAAP